MSPVEKTKPGGKPVEKGKFRAAAQLTRIGVSNVPAGELEALNAALGSLGLVLANDGGPSAIFDGQKKERSFDYLSGEGTDGWRRKATFIEDKGKARLARLEVVSPDARIRTALALPASGGWSLEVENNGDKLKIQQNGNWCHLILPGKLEVPRLGIKLLSPYSYSEGTGPESVLGGLAETLTGNGVTIKVDRDKLWVFKSEAEALETWLKIALNDLEPSALLRKMLLEPSNVFGQRIESLVGPKDEISQLAAAVLGPVLRGLQNSYGQRGALSLEAVDEATLPVVTLLSDSGFGLEVDLSLESGFRGLDHAIQAIVFQVDGEGRLHVAGKNERGDVLSELKMGKDEWGLLAEILDCSPIILKENGVEVEAFRLSLACRYGAEDSLERLQEKLGGEKKQEKGPSSSEFARVLRQVTEIRDLVVVEKEGFWLVTSGYGEVCISPPVKVQTGTAGWKAEVVDNRGNSKSAYLFFLWDGSQLGLLAANFETENGLLVFGLGRIVDIGLMSRFFSNSLLTVAGGEETIRISSREFGIPSLRLQKKAGFWALERRDDSGRDQEIRNSEEGWLLEEVCFPTGKGRCAYKLSLVEEKLSNGRGSVFCVKLEINTDELKEISTTITFHENDFRRGSTLTSFLFDPKILARKGQVRIG